MKNWEKFFKKRLITSKGIDYIFIALLGIFLFIPMLNITNEDLSKNEKRILTQKPLFFNEFGFNERYGANFDNWFNDRFNGRKELIQLHTKLKKEIGSLGTDMVLKGRDGWLFYRGDHSLDNFQNNTLFTEEELQKISKYLSDIHNWAQKNGKSFYYVIIPDKNKIYGEYIRSFKKIRPDEEGRANQLIQYLKTHTEVTVIYPYDTLIKNKDKGLLYYKHDTHWNGLGAFLAYREIVETIGKDYKAVVPVTPIKNKKVLYETGDLSQMINYSVEKDQSEYFEPEITDNSTCVYDSENKDEKYGIECKNKSKKIRLITFRDSFTTRLKEYYNNTFGIVKYVWRWNITPDDLKYIKTDFDVIILETVERYIPSLDKLNFSEE